MWRFRYIMLYLTHALIWRFGLILYLKRAPSCGDGGCKNPRTIEAEGLAWQKAGLGRSPPLQKQFMCVSPVLKGSILALVAGRITLEAELARLNKKRGPFEGRMPDGFFKAWKHSLKTSIEVTWFTQFFLMARRSWKQAMHAINKALYLLLFFPSDLSHLLVSVRLSFSFSLLPSFVLSAVFFQSFFHYVFPSFST